MFFSLTITSFTFLFFSDVNMIICKVKTKDNVFFGRPCCSIALATVRVKIIFMLLYIILIPKYIDNVLLDLGTCRNFCGELLCMVPIKQHQLLGTAFPVCMGGWGFGLRIPMAVLDPKDIETLLPLAGLWMRKTDQK